VGKKQILQVPTPLPAHLRTHRRQENLLLEEGKLEGLQSKGWPTHLSKGK